jgi:hypothetical protein
MHRLFHDFNNLQPGNKEGLTSAPLVCAGTKEDLERQGVTLKEGMEVLLYQPDEASDGSPDSLEVRAKIRYDSKLGCFMGDFVWAGLMHRSEAETKKR